MKKRMTDIDIWDKEWYMALSPKLKCLVKYIFDKCDNAGVWEPNWRLAMFQINDTVGIDDLQEIDGGNQFEILENGNVFIPDYVEFQAGKKLSEKVGAHRNIISLLKKHRLYHRVCDRVSNTLQEREKEEEREKEGDKDSLLNKNGVEEIPDFPQASQASKIYNDHDQVGLAIDEFNEICGTAYKKRNREIRNMIQDLFDLGHTRQDLQAATTLKKIQADDPKAFFKKKDLNPFTIFKLDKFPKYLQTAKDIYDGKDSINDNETPIEKLRRELAHVEI